MHRTGQAENGLDHLADALLLVVGDGLGERAHDEESGLDLEPAGVGRLQDAAQLLEALVGLHHEHDVGDEVRGPVPELGELLRGRKRLAVLGVESTVATYAVDERVDRRVELLTELLALGVRVDLLADVEPEEERALEDLVVVVGAAHQHQVNAREVAQRRVRLVDHVERESVAQLGEYQAKVRTPVEHEQISINEQVEIKVFK